MTALFVAVDRAPRLGGKIVFARLVSGVLGAGNTEPFVMNADGSGITQRTYSPYGDIEPAWSPDGDRVAFQNKRDGNFEICVIGSEGDRRQTADVQPSQHSYDGDELVAAAQAHARERHGLELTAGAIAALLREPDSEPAKEEGSGG